MLFTVFIVRNPRIIQIETCRLVTLAPLWLHSIAIMFNLLSSAYSFIAKTTRSCLLLLLRWRRIWRQWFLLTIFGFFFHASERAGGLMLSKFLIDSELLLAASFLEFAVKFETGEEAYHRGRDLFEHGILLFAIGTGRVLHKPITYAVRTRQLIAALLTLNWLFVGGQELIANSTTKVVGEALCHLVFHYYAAHGVRRGRGWWIRFVHPTVLLNALLIFVHYKNNIS